MAGGGSPNSAWSASSAMRRALRSSMARTNQIASKIHPVPRGAPERYASIRVFSDRSGPVPARGVADGRSLSAARSDIGAGVRIEGEHAAAIARSFALRPHRPVPSFRDGDTVPRRGSQRAEGCLLLSPRVHVRGVSRQGGQAIAPRSCWRRTLRMRQIPPRTGSLWPRIEVGACVS